MGNKTITERIRRPGLTLGVVIGLLLSNSGGPSIALVVPANPLYPASSGIWQAVPGPSLLSPPDGSATVDITPAFSWNKVDGATRYRIQVDDSADLSSPILDSEPNDSDYTPRTRLLAGIYFWHVRAYAGSWSAYSLTWTFSVNGAPPPAPDLLSPSDGSSTPDITPSFDWSDVPGAHHYRIQIDDNDDFSSLAAESDPTDSDYAPTKALPAGRYFWHVRTNDGMGNWGDWSSAWTLEVNGAPPPAPTLLVPADGSTTSDLTPPFDWSDVPGAHHYRVQIDDNDDFSSPAADSEPIASDYTPSKPLAAGTCFWHVRTNDGLGNWGDWSPAWTLTVSGVLLPAPTLLSPLDGSTTPDFTPPFDWADVPGAHHYRVQIDDNADFSSPAADSEPTASTYTPGSQLASGTYFWRGRTNDGLGNWGDWSAAWQVVVNGTLPPTPTLIVPADGLATPDFTPLFDWSDVPGAHHYRIQVDDNVDFSSPVADSEPGASAYTPGNQLANGIYYWHVRTNDGMGNWGGYSPTWRVVISGTLPAVPTLLSPGDSSTTPDLTPSFDWSDVSGADHYRIQLDDNADFSSLIVDSCPTSSAFTPGNQLTKGTYFWHVRTNDGTGNWGDWSPAWRVIVSGSPLPAPTLLSPPDSSTTPDLTPSFAWSDVPGADHYRVQIDDNVDFSSPAADSEPIASEYTPGNQLPKGTYFWHVRTNDSMGNWGSYSSTWKLIVSGAPPPAPTLLTPQNGSDTPDLTPPFDWSDVPGADHYRVQIDDNSDFSSPVADSEPAASAYTPGNQLPGGTYYWHVRTADGMGNWGDWSPAWQVTVNGALPTLPTLLSPPDSASTQDITPSFDWSNTPGAHHYRIQVDDNSDFSSPVADAQPNRSDYTPRTKLMPGTYYWRVRAADNMGNWGDYSRAWRFMVSLIAPQTTVPTPALLPVPTRTPGPVVNDTSVSTSPPAPGAKTIYLTFDDGPDPSYTPQLAVYLHERRVQGTFFLTGSSRSGAGGGLFVTCVPRRGDLVSIDVLSGRRVVEVIDERGFAIGLHGWFHGSIVYPQDLWNDTAFDIRTNIAQEETALAMLGISFKQLLRAPGGAFPEKPFYPYQSWYAYGWDVDARDDYGVSPQAIVDRVLEELSDMPDAPIILLHAGRPNTLQAIADPRYDLIGKIFALGYTQFGALPRPIDHSGYPPNGAVYTTGP